MRWDKAKLTDVCDFQGGTQPPKSEWSTEPKDGYIRMLQIRDYTQGKDNHVEYVKNSKSLKKCTADDIMIGRYGASIGKILTGLSGAYNVALVKTVPSSALDRGYLYYFLQSGYFQNFIQNAGSRAAQAGFNKDELSNLDIPVPPFAIQKQIADTLDKADALCRKDQVLLQKYEELAQSIFYEMFGDPVRNQREWKEMQFGDVIKSIQAGTSVGGEERELQPGEFGVLKISAVTSGVFKEEEFKVPAPDKVPQEKVTVEAGDLLFSRANTRELVGAVAIPEKSYPNLMLPDKLWRIDLDHELVVPHYCMSLLWDEKIRFNLTKTATGTSGSMLNISMGKLKDLIIPVPPIGLQRKFETAVKKVLAEKQLVENTLKHSTFLFNGLLTQYFN